MHNFPTTETFRNIIQIFHTYEAQYKEAMNVWKVKNEEKMKRDSAMQFSPTSTGGEIIISNFKKAVYYYNHYDKV